MATPCVLSTFACLPTIALCLGKTCRENKIRVSTRHIDFGHLNNKHTAIKKKVNLEPKPFFFAYIELSGSDTTDE